MRILVAFALLAPTSALACAMPHFEARELAQVMDEIDAATVAPAPVVAEVAAPAPAPKPVAPTVRPAPKPTAAPSVIPEVAAQPDS